MTDEITTRNQSEYNSQNHEKFVSLYNEVLKNTPIQEFSFQRFYVGGQNLSLFSHVGFAVYYFSERKDLGKKFSEEIKNLKESESRFFLWPSPDTDDPVFKRAYSFNIWGGLTLYMRKGNVVNAFHFSGRPGYDMSNFYINNIENLKMFVEHFQNKSQDLINVNDNSILGLHTGEYILDEFNQGISSAKGKLILRQGDLHIALTAQETKCLEMLAKGFSVKWIARELSLSPRTVEGYLNCVKEKTNVRTKDSLVNFFHHSLHFSS